MLENMQILSNITTTCIEIYLIYFGYNMLKEGEKRGKLILILAIIGLIVSFINYSLQILV